MIRWLVLHLFGCRHEWRNTGLSHTDPEFGFTIVLRECRVCGLTIIVEV